MAKTKKSSRKPEKRDRHLTPVIVTASGTVVAGKRRIEAFLKKSESKVVISEVHHFAMLPYLRVARDEEGHLHLATITRCDEEGWTVLG